MLGSPVQRPALRRYVSTKMLLAEGDDSAFAEHCRRHEDSYRVRGGGPGTRRLGKRHPFWPRCSGQSSTGHPAC